MMWKNRNKKVGLCVMVVTGCFILAALWVVLATPETALAKGKPGSDVAYNMVIDTVNFVHESAPLLTVVTVDGDGSPWTFFTRGTVTPTGSTYAIGGPKTGVVLQFKERKGVLSGLSVGGIDAESVWYVSDVVPVDPLFDLVAGEDMVIVVNVDNIPIHRQNKRGPVIGTIAIGAIRLTVQ